MNTKKQGDEIVEYLKQHWIRWVILAVTSTLTGTAALNLTGSWVYVVFLVLLAEGSSIYWLGRIEEFGNNVQAFLSGTGSVLSVASIAITDLASVTIIARQSQLQIFTMFQQVPVWAQNTVVYVLPILAISHFVLYTAYHYFSESASTMRKINSTKREAKLDIERSKQDELRNLARANAERIGKDQARMDWERMNSLPVSSASIETDSANPTPPPSKK